MYNRHMLYFFGWLSNKSQDIKKASVTNPNSAIADGMMTLQFFSCVKYVEKVDERLNDDVASVLHQSISQLYHHCPNDVGDKDRLKYVYLPGPFLVLF